MPHWRRQRRRRRRRHKNIPDFRNWSHYDFIHDRKRNRLTADRAKDLVFVFSNGRLLHETSRVGHHEAAADFDSV